MAGSGPRTVPRASPFAFPDTVTFEESGETRKVRGWCRVCLAGREAYGTGCVSPSGLMHVGVDGGDTKCGHDATGDDWWWPL